MNDGSEYGHSKIGKTITLQCLTVSFHTVPMTIFWDCALDIHAQKSTRQDHWQRHELKHWRARTFFNVLSINSVRHQSSNTSSPCNDSLKTFISHDRWESRKQCTVISRLCSQKKRKELAIRNFPESYTWLWGQRNKNGYPSFEGFRQAKKHAET